MQNDFKNACFDAIVSYHVIHLLEDIEKVLQKIHDLLKPGGLFILTTVCLKDKITLKKRLEIYAFLVIKNLEFFP
ncbi:class I SAM-dependent methyltransferase [Saccharicrinis sp. FJH62]|uniref:class I SAM-dependent methyltransferase n=1 Tax=Saccharicrinis sp. FJH62 TaxID=3344657 RepID=UPI0035D505E8